MLSPNKTDALSILVITSSVTSLTTVSCENDLVAPVNSKICISVLDIDRPTMFICRGVCVTGNNNRRSSRLLKADCKDISRELVRVTCASFQSIFMTLLRMYSRILMNAISALEPCAIAFVHSARIRGESMDLEMLDWNCVTTPP